LQNDIAAGDLITMDTKSSGSLPYSLVNSHAYMFESVTVVNGTPMVRLGNPWGCNQPADIPFSQLAAGIAEVDVGQFVNSNLITGGPGNDTTTLSAIVNNASIDLGAGSDKLTFANGTNSASVANVETIVGGTGSDTVVLTTAAAGDSIDLGGSSDALTFGNFANSATVANTETITGGAGNDIITLGTALTGTMRVDLGGGVNKLVLASTGNSGNVSNVGTLIGGSGNDSITLATAALNGSIDLGGGNDVLRLANTTNQVTVGNVETIQGGSGNDTIVLTGSAAAMVSGGGGMNFITGNTGADTFVLDQNSSTSCTRLMNFNPALGDKLALDTTGSAVMPGNAYDLGGATLSSRDLIAVANAKALHTTVLNNGGKGGFVYEQDTGQLFYSSNGLYAASINPIGVITTNGVMPWAFNANSIVQV
ncbi:MAG TPA: calcium-binding protein, partial [Acetobacteraceae bacterium]|nr:calcium-binding protein [Acetobacteraceae bacterium]